MVSFSCEGCGDVLTKKKLDQHRNRCHGASFTCIDCMVDFPGTSYRSHTACMTEDQKYQGALYQGPKKKGNKNKNASQAALISQKQAYVEDADDDDDAYSGRPFAVDPPEEEEYLHNLPAAPSPPPAAPDFDQDTVNVFDFLDNSQTPNASNLDLSALEPTPMVEDTPQNDRSQDEEFTESALVQYNYGPDPNSAQENTYETPMPATRNKKVSKSSDRKRKHLHVETQDLDASPARDTEDSLMTDAPPVLHSGLTGGLKGLLARPSVFPPSPDYSGDAAEPDPSPGSPLKKPKHAKTSSSKRKLKRGESISNNIMSFITNGGLPPKHADDLPRKKKSSSKDTKEKKASSSSHKKKAKTSSSLPDLKAIEPAAQKLLEYKQPNGQGQGQAATDVDADTKMVLYQARAELFMSFVNKGPESERGCSMNKALKRYHRECEGLGISQGKSGEEKELWRSLRLKRNERGEVVVFF